MNASRRKTVWTWAATLLLGWTAATATTAIAAAEPFELQPGIIVHPDRDSAYLMTPGGGLEEIDVRTGRVLWRTTEADKPLAASGDLLLAQVDTRSSTLELVVFDRTAPVATPRRTRIELPAGAVALIDEERDRSFSTTSRVDDGNAYVTWSYVERPTIKRQIHEPPAVKERTGAVRVDLGSAKTDVVPVASVPPDPALRVAESVAKSTAPNEHRSRPALVGDKFVVTNVTRGNDSQAVVTIERWSADTGQRLEDLPLFEGEVRSRWTSADGRHVLLGRSSGLDDFDNSYVWVVHSVESGNELGRRFDKIAGGAFFVPYGSALVYETTPWGYLDGESWHDIPRRLQSTDLSARTEGWSRDIRDTAYRGSQVPTR